MLRALWFIARLALLVAVAAWCAQRPGTAEIAWNGWLVETSAGFMAAALLLFLAAWTLLYRLWRAVAEAPRALARARDLRRLRRGYRDVTSGLVAVAAGDAESADKYARRAALLIPDTPLTKLLSAQAHQLNGDGAAARRDFTALLQDGGAAFFGLRGLLQEALQSGDVAEALTHIRAAEALQPRRAWVLKTLFDLETRNREWRRAAAALKKAEKCGVFTAAEARRRAQALLLARADDAFASGDVVAAHKLARKAFTMDASFIPAALRLVKFHLHAGKTGAALKTIRRAWAAAPHPDLAETWMKHAPVPKKTASPYDEGREDYQWAKRLSDLNPAHACSARLLGEAALRARRWSEARELLEQGRDYRALAKLERAETGNETRAREWLEIAAESPPEPKWVCRDCGHAALDWAPLCRRCGVFDASSWMAPEPDVYRLPAAGSDEISFPLLMRQ